MSAIGENAARIRDNVALACRTAGRNPASVRVMAVTKFVETARIAEALKSGIRLAGENRAQELKEKLTFFELHDCRVHFIGQLQSNKIKYVCGHADVIESLDSFALADALDRRAQAMGVVQDMMVQVNIGGEEQKGGVSSEALLPFIESLARCSHLRVCGLMCIPPDVEPEAARPYFTRMRTLYERARDAFPQLPLNELSMGMSRDYPVAIQEGATIVRVGTALFGARNVNK